MNNSPAIIIDPARSPEEEAAHTKRIEDCRALFTEALRRYKVQRDQIVAAGGRGRSDKMIVTMALKTLIMNGYNKAEIMDAMS